MKDHSINISLSSLAQTIDIRVPLVDGQTDFNTISLEIEKKLKECLIGGLINAIKEVKEAEQCHEVAKINIRIDRLIEYVDIHFEADGVLAIRAKELRPDS